MLMPMRPYSPLGRPFGPAAPNVSAADASPPRARSSGARPAASGAILRQLSPPSVLLYSALPGPPPWKPNAFRMRW
jgi:hypothetical protein